MSEQAVDRLVFAPGGWYAVLGEEVALLLPPGAGPRAAAAWERVDGGAGFEEVLDGVLVDGLRSLPGFVLVSRSGDDTRVVVRGDATVRVAGATGQVEVDGRSAGTWTEHTVAGATGWTVEVERSSAAADLAVVSGLVRVSLLSSGTAAAADGQPAAQAADPAPGHRLGANLRPQAADPAPAQAADPAPAQAADGPPLAVPDPEAPVVAPAPGDHDGDTNTDLPAQAAAAQRPGPGIPGQPPAPEVTARPVARLVFSTGEVVDVDRAILVGRAPEGRRFASTDQPRLVTVPSPHQEISSTHLEVRPGSGADHGMAVVTDMGSTNGTVLVQPGLPPEDLQPGMAVSLIPGAILDLGDGVTIQTTNP